MLQTLQVIHILCKPQKDSPLRRGARHLAAGECQGRGGQEFISSTSPDNRNAFKNFKTNGLLEYEGFEIIKEIIEKKR